MAVRWHLGRLFTRGAFFPDSRSIFGVIRGLSSDVLGLPEEKLDESTKIAIQKAGKGLD
jgi:hypothetical protein